VIKLGLIKIFPNLAFIRDSASGNQGAFVERDAFFWDVLISFRHPTACWEYTALV
jgi:hypothetical protein